MKKTLIRTCFACLALIAFVLTLFFSRTDAMASKQDIFIEDVFVEEIPEFSIQEPEINVQNISIEEAFLRLDEVYQKLIPQLEAARTLKENIEALNEEMDELFVCREVNIAFNSLNEEYQSYLSSISYVKIYFSQYETYFSALDSKLILSPDAIYEEYEDVFASEKNMESIHTARKELADKLFEQDYELTARLMNGEAGNRKPYEQYCVMDVAYNRVKYPGEYEDNLLDVIYQSDQYACVVDGNFDKEPPAKVWQNAEDYLRGRSEETGMPENVVYQALFEQGSRVWYGKESTKNIFCFK